MSKDNVVEVLLDGGAIGRAWESRPGKWSWAHPNGSDGCNCHDQAEAEAELQECDHPTTDAGTVESCQHCDLAVRLSRLAERLNCKAIPGHVDYISKASAGSVASGLMADADGLARRAAMADGLAELMRAAVLRVQIANDCGDTILSAWMPDARAALADYDAEKGVAR